MARGFFIGDKASVSTALLHFRVVLVTVDAARLLVLLLVNRLAILMGQVPVILRAHASLFLVDARFLVLQPAGFARCQLAALYAVGDPALLVALALLDVVVVLPGSRGRLCQHGNRRENQGSRKEKMSENHG